MLLFVYYDNGIVIYYLQYYILNNIDNILLYNYWYGYAYTNNIILSIYICFNAIKLLINYYYDLICVCVLLFVLVLLFVFVLFFDFFFDCDYDILSGIINIFIILFIFLYFINNWIYYIVLFVIYCLL